MSIWGAAVAGVSGERRGALLCRGRYFQRPKPSAADASSRGERVTVMVTADKLMVALIRGRSSALPDEADANVVRARSRERILLVQRTLARRRQRVIAVRRLP